MIVNIRYQGLIFNLLALTLVTISLLLPRLDASTELFIFVMSVLVLGVPHGALDPIYAKHLFAARGFTACIKFICTYVGIALLVIIVWQFVPILFLILFLFASTFHFSGDPVPGTPWLVRFLYGGAVIVLPTFNYPLEITRFFSYIVDANSADYFVTVLRFLSWPWVIAIFISVCIIYRRDRFTALELASYCILVLTVPPLISFAVFFCVMHSARHAMRTQQFFSLDWRYLIYTSLAPTLAVFFAALIIWFFTQDAPLEMRLVQLVVIGLAALTAPHMLLIERVRFSILKTD